MNITTRTRRVLGSTLAAASLAGGLTLAAASPALAHTTTVSTVTTKAAPAAFRPPAPSYSTYIRCTPKGGVGWENCRQWEYDTRVHYPRQMAPIGFPEFTQIGHQVMAKRASYHYNLAFGADKTHLRARIADEVVRYFGLSLDQRNMVCWMIANPGFNVFQ